MPGREEEYLAKEAEYRAHAEEVRLLASQSLAEQDRVRLQRIADAWDELAERMKRLAGN